MEKYETCGGLAYSAMLAENEAPFDEEYCIGIAKLVFSGEIPVIPDKLHYRVLLNLIISYKKFVFSGTPKFRSSCQYENFVKSVHSEISKGTDLRRKGEWRKNDVTVGIHSPPSFHTIPIEMREWGNSAFHMRNETLGLRLDKKTYVATCVSSFMRIHPFEDFNGRTGRILANALLLDIGLSVSRLGKNNEFTTAVRSGVNGDISLLKRIL